jgi:putative DNA primase/helicase
MRSLCRCVTIWNNQDTPSGILALNAECEAIQTAPCGAQEKSLNDGALRIGAFVGGGSLNMKTACAKLIAAGNSMVSYNAEDPWKPRQIEKKVIRALKQGCDPSRRTDPIPHNFDPSFEDVFDEQQIRSLIYVQPGALHMIATEAETALLENNAPLFVRGGLVRPVIDEIQVMGGKTSKVARLVPVDADMLTDHLSRAAQWFKRRNGKDVPTNPPLEVARIILSRDGEWRFRRLAGVITTPTLRPNGTILSKPGYDRGTQLLLLDPPALPPIPEQPSKDDALEALLVLESLLQEFPFVDEASRSVALSALITPVVRGAMAVAPLHATTAPVAGSGKSYIIDLASAISIGQRAPVIAAGRTEEETEKRLAAAALNGQPIISIDNVNGELGGDTLCQIIERPVVSVRPLGLSKLVRIESRATCFATGNNIRLVGDMTRRVILCSLDPAMERPELRLFDKDPFEAVLNDRGKYIAAALTVPRAYIAADCPDALPALASFEDWSRVVRSALVWLGRADPVSTMDRARAEDPITANLRGLLVAWYASVGSLARTAGQVKAFSETWATDGTTKYAALTQALLEVAEDRRGGVDAKRLGRFLSQYQGRVVGGLKFVATDDAHAKQRLWKVVRQQAPDASGCG